MTWQAASLVLLGLALAAGFAWYERERPPARVVAVVAALAALAVVGRLAFAAIPNVKPTTDIVLFAGYALGAIPGFAVGAVTAIVSNIARYHRRGLPQDSHLPFIALDRTDRLIVNKLAAILRLVNALDAEHAQKVRDARLVRNATTWTLELEGDGALTMEQLAATARSDMFAQIYGRPPIVRPARIIS